MAAQLLCPFLMLLFVFLLLSSNISLHILNISPLSGNYQQKFSPILMVVFHFHDGTLYKKLINLMKFNLSIFLFSLLIFVSYLRNFCLIQDHQCSLLFSSKYFIFLDLTFRCIIRFEIFVNVCSEEAVQLHCGYRVVHTPVVEMTIPFYSLNCLRPLVRNQFIKTVRFYFWTLSVVLLFYTSILIPIFPILKYKMQSFFC